MKRNRIHGRNSIIFRWILIVLLAIIPFEVLNLHVNISNSNAVLQEIEQSAVANVVYLSESFDESIQNTGWQMDQLLTDLDIQSIYTLNGFMSTSEYYMKAREIVSLLSMVCRSNSFISGMTLYYPGLDLYLSTAVPHIRNTDRETVGSRISLYHQSQNGLAEENGRLLIGRADISTTPKSTGIPLYYAEAMIDTETVADLLSSYNEYSASNAFMLRSTDGHIIKSRSCIAFSQEDEQMVRALLKESGDITGNRTIRLGDQTYTMFCQTSKQTGCIFCQLVSNERLYGITNRMRLFSIILITVAFILIILLAKIAHHDVYRPITDLKKALKKIGSGDFDIDLREQYTDEFNELAAQLKKMARQLYDLVEHNYRQEVLIQKARYKQLQAQISPHFLYNSFYFLENMIDLDDLDSAKAFLTHLSAYYQYLTWNDTDTVSLQDEYRHVMNYLAIQNMRFGSRMVTDTQELPETWREVYVPRLILQPVLENALTYSREPDRTTVIAVSFKEDYDMLSVIMEDNGTRLTDEKIAEIRETITTSGNTSALRNINERLGICYHRNDLMTADRSDLGGLRITIRVERRPFDGTDQRADR